jgi:hypothetical protein
MSKIEQNKINHAVQRCLARCYAAKDVLATLAAFLQELRHLEGWPERDVHDVELAVLKVLNRIVEPPESPAQTAVEPTFNSPPAGLDAADVSDA